ncbi:2-(1,2-epoxy-1,2-dihydrophenyl)acetyl-CoA isomerase [Microbacterium resistens]|uniref:2-(1,2-epoxy-1,2-dihydrophenyl)acetyl-CoA isomerase n=1 Tax=Microbacterium resistens TaxID=156977 RepID=A0ABU1SAH5_9MICO|nr:enoyl-CoA hydratase/isomerase family protein [Microbacterium resistens]MDR6866611.1 2-(1,2-epoxy-1,2-dihydrophenyl)acetyl-CoA isomerase [Microbacterium resistens]
MPREERLPGMRVSRDGDIVRVVFDDEATRNALGGDALAALTQTISGIRPGDVLVLAGDGGSFTSGGDRRELAPRGTFEEQVTSLRAKAALVERIRALDAVSIAAIDGACVGLGVGLAAACTLRIASERAFLDTAYLRNGMSGDFGAAHLLGALVGRGTAADWLLRPRRIPADELVRRGFCQAQWPSTTFTLETSALAQELAAQSSVARQGIVGNLRDADRLDLTHALDAETRRHVLSKSSPREVLPAL